MTRSSSVLTPALLDLMEHEKPIEQAAQGLLDMAWAFGQIKDGKKYRARYPTWDEYCEKRWGLTPQHVNRIIESAQIVRGIAARSEPRGSLLPTNEKQVRPLAALPTVEEQTAAWEEAVEDADGEQPTAKQVTEAVERRKQPTEDDRPPVSKPDLGGGVSHPARFSDALLEAFAQVLDADDYELILDPFAGTGRIHELREIGKKTIGVELEPEWATLSEHTILGDACDLIFEDGEFDAICTSPTYGNRLADHHNASDPHLRRSYTHDLGRALSDNNSGAMQWSYEYRVLHRRAWAEAVRVLRPGGLFVLNIKDHIRGGVHQPVTAWHVATLVELGLRYDPDASTGVPTKHLKQGDNTDDADRAGQELVLVLRKGPA